PHIPPRNGLGTPPRVPSTRTSNSWPTAAKPAGGTTPATIPASQHLGRKNSSTPKQDGPPKTTTIPAKTSPTTTPKTRHSNRHAHVPGNPAQLAGKSALKRPKTT